MEDWRIHIASTMLFACRHFHLRKLLSGTKCRVPFLLIVPIIAVTERVSNILDMENRTVFHYFIAYLLSSFASKCAFMPAFCVLQFVKTLLVDTLRFYTVVTAVDIRAVIFCLSGRKESVWSSMQAVSRISSVTSFSFTATSALVGRSPNLICSVILLSVSSQLFDTGRTDGNTF